MLRTFTSADMHKTCSGTAETQPDGTRCWVLLQNLIYQNKETILFTIDPYWGNLN